MNGVINAGGRAIETPFGDADEQLRELQRERLHLRAVVVHVVLALDRPSGGLQQSPVDALHGGAGCDPELLSEQNSQALVGAECLGDVAAPRERFHKEAVPGLAVGRKLGQHPGAFLGLREELVRELGL